MPWCCFGRASASRFAWNSLFNFSPKLVEVEPEEKPFELTARMKIQIRISAALHIISQDWAKAQSLRFLPLYRRTLLRRRLRRCSRLLPDPRPRL